MSCIRLGAPNHAGVVASGSKLQRFQNVQQTHEPIPGLRSGSTISSILL
jgi:hypothetical protein